MRAVRAIGRASQSPIASRSLIGADHRDARASRARASPPAATARRRGRGCARPGRARARPCSVFGCGFFCALAVCVRPCAVYLNAPASVGRQLEHGRHVARDERRQRRQTSPRRRAGRRRGARARRRSMTFSDGATRASSPSASSTSSSTTTTGAAMPDAEHEDQAEHARDRSRPASSPMPPRPIGSAVYESASARSSAWCTLVAKHDDDREVARRASRARCCARRVCGSIKEPSDRPI